MAAPLIVAAGALQAIGTITAGNEADKVGSANARALEGQAGSVRAATVQREGMVRSRNRDELSKQRAALLQSGVDPGSGSALVGVTQSTYDAELDALTTRYEGMLQAQGLDTQAAMSRYEGKARKKQSRVSAAGQLLTTAANAYAAGGIQKPAPISTGTIRWL
jgi:hypothetical protein